MQAYIIAIGWQLSIVYIFIADVNKRMQNTEKLCLRWNDFQENLNSAFGQLRNDRDFADVTLACEDGTQIETHRVILASTSPFFMEVLKKNKHPRPLIYMRGLKATELVAMVDFLYFGEANVDQESLELFLGLAEELKLKGLTGSSSEGMEFRGKEAAYALAKNIEERKPIVKTNPTVTKPLDVTSSVKRESSSSAALVSVEDYQLEEQTKSMMTVTEKEMQDGNQKRKVWACNICGKEGKRENMKMHIESNHITSNSPYSCDICGKVSRSRDGLRQHKGRGQCK